MFISKKAGGGGGGSYSLNLINGPVRRVGRGGEEAIPRHPGPGREGGERG